MISVLLVALATLINLYEFNDILESLSAVNWDNLVGLLVLI